MTDDTMLSPIEAPPPAYEIAQFDFDQKLTIAAERSLDLSEQGHQREQDASEEDRKEYDETRRSDASRSTEPQSTSRVNELRSTVRPLTFRRKTRSSNRRRESSNAKERPSWLSGAHLGVSTSSSEVSSRSLPRPVPREMRDSEDRTDQHILPDDSDEDHSNPPPPFATVDTSLDGTVYERYGTNDMYRRRTGTVVLRYNGQDPAGSPPPSPPHSPIARHSSQNAHLRQRAASPQINAVNNVYQHAPQQSTLQARDSLPRPRSAEPQRHIPPPPRLNFDPSVAYEETRSSIYCRLPVDPQAVNRDVTALYSAAVAPHLSSQKRHPAAPKVRRYSPSVTSLPEYDQYQESQGISSGKPIYSVQDYAASNATVYSQTPVIHIPQYPRVAQYQMTQYPRQQNYTLPTSPAHQGDSQRWSTARAPYQSHHHPR